jgi:hypothetical protein
MTSGCNGLLPAGKKPQQYFERHGGDACSLADVDLRSVCPKGKWVMGTWDMTFLGLYCYNCNEKFADDCDGTHCSGLATESALRRLSMTGWLVTVASQPDTPGGKGA